MQRSFVNYTMPTPDCVYVVRVSVHVCVRLCVVCVCVLSSPQLYTYMCLSDSVYYNNHCTITTITITNTTTPTTTTTTTTIVTNIHTDTLAHLHVCIHYTHCETTRGYRCIGLHCTDTRKSLLR